MIILIKHNKSYYKPRPCVRILYNKKSQAQFLPTITVPILH